MNEQTVLEQLEVWGYCLLPKSHPESLGYPELLVVIRDKHTGAHDDPESIRLWLQEGGVCIDWTTLRLKMFSRKTYHVCPGSVILRDWCNKEVEFYTFGGSIEIVTFPGETWYSLRSPAPILAINRSPSGVLDQLAFETMAILDEQRAKWGVDDRSFARRLSSTDPLQLYLVTLQSTLGRFEHYRALRFEYGKLYQALLREREWLISANLWPTDPSNLEELLSQGHAQIGQLLQETGIESEKHLQTSNV